MPSPDPITIGNRLELLIDRHLIASSRGLRHQAITPRREEVVLAFDRPWEGPFSGYVTVLHDPLIGEHRLYYRGHWPALASGSRHPFSHAGQCLCLATSSDGIHWRRPELNLHPLPEAARNNILLLDQFPHTHNFTPFLDTRPDVPEQERYKALAGGEPQAGIVAYASADGVHWRLLHPEPVITGEGFDSMNVAFWSVHEQCYVAYVRTWTGPDATGWRTISRCTSPDFQQWSPLREMHYGPGGRVDYYTNQTHPYPRAPHHYFGWAARFLEGRGVVSADVADYLQVDDRYQNDCSDVVLLTSRGGGSYQRCFLEAVIRPAIGPEHWTSRSNYPALGLLQTSRHQLSLYLNQCYGQPSAHVQRYSYEQDRIACFEAGRRPGELVTKPLLLAPGQLQLNLATAAAGEALVELQAADGTPLPGYSLAECRPMTGNELARPVVWKANHSLTSLSSQPVRIRVRLQEASLFAMQVRQNGSSSLGAP